MNKPFLPSDHPITRAEERKSWSRVLAACALAEIQKADPRKILRANWPNDDRAQSILRAAQSPTDTSSIPCQATSVTTWRSLAPAAAAWKLFDHPSALRLDLTGLTTIKMPNIAALPPAPVFVAEGSPAPVLQWAFGKTELGPAKKILVISAVTEELNYATPENAAAVIGPSFSEATAKSIDTIAFDTNPATAVRPAGLLNGVRL